MIVLEETLIAEVGNKALVDGHDAGSGEMNIFIHTNDPRRIFEKILSSQIQSEVKRRDHRTGATVGSLINLAFGER